MLTPPAAPANAGPPAGWHPDPLHPGGWRWWDGRAWTAHASRPADAAAARRKPRLPRWLSVPVVICAPLVALLVGVLAFVAPISVVAGVVPLVIVLPALAWLDRVEPEPTSSRIHAVLWGASVAIVVALIVNVSVAGAAGTTIAAVVSAPLIEEAMKGLGIVWAVRRGEVDGVTDGVVFAGWAAIGFAAVEDVTYFADTESPAQLLLVFVLRAVLTPFAHPLFTMWIGLAIGRAVRDGRPLWPHALWGYAAAVAAHALWNGSLALAAPDPDTGEGGLGAGVLLVVLPLFIALFVAVVVVLVRMRREEQRRFVAQWPFLVQRYGLGPDERQLFVDWHRMLDARKRLPRRQRRHFDAMRASLWRLSMLHQRLVADPDKERVLVAQLDTHRERLGLAPAS